MTESEWLSSNDPDLLLEFLIGKVTREQLVRFVSTCWLRALPHVPSHPSGRTAADEFRDIADQLTDFDAARYASDAILRAARWAPDLRQEQAHQAQLLRQIVGDPYR
jgi:hypothetical protein